MTTLSQGIEVLRCQTHSNVPAYLTCIHKQCQEVKRSSCLQCVQEFQKLKECLLSHPRDVVQWDKWNLNEFFLRMKKENIGDEEFALRSILNINRVRLQKAGAIIFKHLEKRSYMEISQIDKWKEEELEQFLQFSTSRYFLQNAIDELQQSSKDSLSEQIEQEDEGVKNKKEENIKNGVETFINRVEELKMNLKKCQEMFYMQESVLDKITEEEANELAEEINKQINKFLEKKVKKRRNKQREQHPKEQQQQQQQLQQQQVEIIEIEEEEENKRIETVLPQQSEKGEQAQESGQKITNKDETPKSNNNVQASKKKNKKKLKKNKKKAQNASQENSQSEIILNDQIEDQSCEQKDQSEKKQTRRQSHRSEKKDYEFNKITPPPSPQKKEQQSQIEILRCTVIEKPEISTNITTIHNQEVHQIYFEQNQPLPEQQMNVEQNLIEINQLQQFEELQELISEYFSKEEYSLQDLASATNCQNIVFSTQEDLEQIIIEEDEQVIQNPFINQIIPILNVENENIPCVNVEAGTKGSPIEVEEDSSNQSLIFTQEIQPTQKKNKIVKQKIQKDPTPKQQISKYPIVLNLFSADEIINEIQTFETPKQEAKKENSTILQSNEERLNSDQLTHSQEIQNEHQQFSENDAAGVSADFQQSKEMSSSSNQNKNVSTRRISQRIKRPSILSQSPISKVENTQIKANEKSQITASKAKLQHLESIQLQKRHKISKLVLSSDESQMVAVCGGWEKSSGKALLLELNHNNKRGNMLNLIKIFSSGLCKFTDAAFLNKDKHVCLAAQDGLHMFSTEPILNIKPNQKEQEDKTEILKIVKTFSVRSLLIHSQFASKNPFELVLGGNECFEILHLRKNLKDHETINAIKIKGQIECQQFLMKEKFVAFVIMEQQTLNIYDLTLQKISSTSDPVGFEVWSLQINPLNQEIYIGGGSKNIDCYYFDTSLSRLDKIRSINSNQEETLLSFQFFGQFIFIGASDSSFKAFFLNKEQQQDISEEELIYQSKEQDYLMPNLQISHKFNTIFVACQLAHVSAFKINV